MRMLSCILLKLVSSDFMTTWCMRSCIYGGIMHSSPIIAKGERLAPFRALSWKIVWSLAQKNNKERSHPSADERCEDQHSNEMLPEHSLSLGSEWVQGPHLSLVFLFYFSISLASEATPGHWVWTRAACLALTSSISRWESLSHSVESLDCQDRRAPSLRSVGDPEKGSEVTDCLPKLSTTEPQKDAGSVGLFNFYFVKSSLILSLLAWMIPDFPWSAFHKQGGTWTRSHFSIWTYLTWSHFSIFTYFSCSLKTAICMFKVIYDYAALLVKHKI